MNVNTVLFIMLMVITVGVFVYVAGVVVGPMKKRKMTKIKKYSTMPKCTDCNEELNIDGDKIRPCMHCMDKSWKEGYEIGTNEGFNKGKISHIIDETLKT